MKLSANNIILKLLDLLLLTAAVLKGYELLIEPVANTDIWSNRFFLIFTVEFELALAIWLLLVLSKRYGFPKISTNRIRLSIYSFPELSELTKIFITGVMGVVPFVLLNIVLKSETWIGKEHAGQ